jgi:hypothetical protein
MSRVSCFGDGEGSEVLEVERVLNQAERMVGGKYVKALQVRSV